MLRERLTENCAERERLGYIVLRERLGYTVIGVRMGEYCAEIEIVRRLC